MERETLFDFDWRFFRGEVRRGEDVACDDGDWRRVDLPHDWSIEDLPKPSRLKKGQVISGPFDSAAPGEMGTAFTMGGTAWYRKHFSLPKSFDGKRVRVTFDGVYMNAGVWINGVHLGLHPYGYTDFSYDITDHLQFGARADNVLAVEVKNEGRNGRWYSGSGIYRHVWLTVTDAIHVEHRGVCVTTPVVTAAGATVRVEASIRNLMKQAQRVVLETEILSPRGSAVATHATEFVAGLEQPYRSVECLEVKRPMLWSPESPRLYRLILTLKRNGRPIDRTEIPFGIRSIAVSAENGFQLNGETILLKGGCMHHDNGMLGACAFDRAEERRVALMKASGFNAIRCAHNPPSLAFLDACDRLGMLVIDETFDMWNNPKRPDDYHKVFVDWWRRDTESMVRRDCNHPSVIMWSIGNEIQERKSPLGARCAREQADFVRALDPTRPVTAGLRLWVEPETDTYCSALDVVGYNYLYAHYESDHKRLDQRIMMGTETYPKVALETWEMTERCPWVIGDFVWTGYDYIGEASIGWLGLCQKAYWPWTIAWCGDHDLCGCKRPQSYYRDIVWRTGRELALFVEAPELTLQPPWPKKKPNWDNWEWPDEFASWTWPGAEGRKLTIHAYTRCERVVLKLNGKQVASQRVTKGSITAEFHVPYKPGELTAVAYNGRRKVAEETLVTAGPPARIRLKPDRRKLRADGQDLCFVDIEAVDTRGRLIPDAANRVRVTVTGGGKLIALGNAKPDSIESFQQPERSLFRGRGLAVIRCGTRVGEILVEAAAAGLKPARTTVRLEYPAKPMRPAVADQIQAGSRP